MKHKILMWENFKVKTYWLTDFLKDYSLKTSEGMSTAIKWTVFQGKLQVHSNIQF